MAAFKFTATAYYAWAESEIKSLFLQLNPSRPDIGHASFYFAIDENASYLQRFYPRHLLTLYYCQSFVRSEYLFLTTHQMLQLYGFNHQMHVRQ
jgi:hypothetical protein